MDSALFVKYHDNEILSVQIYVVDIIFGSTNEFLCQEFSKCMHREFDISIMGPLKYFLGLQSQQRDNMIFINQLKYIQDLLNKYDMVNIKQSPTPMVTSTLILK